jgi:hypothetical protein
MGVNYRQSCIIGLELGFEDLKVVTSPAVYEMQNRYNTKTGKIEKQEKVLVKSEEWHIEFQGKAYKDYYDIGRDLPKWISVVEDYGRDCLYIGISLGAKDFGRVDLIECSLSLEDINSQFEKVQKLFPDKKIEMHFWSNIG